MSHAACPVFSMRFAHSPRMVRPRKRTYHWSGHAAHESHIGS